MRYLRKAKDIKVIQRGGAVEACWAHNPEDGRSKLLSATFYYFLNEHYKCSFLLSLLVSINKEQIKYSKNK